LGGVGGGGGMALRLRDMGGFWHTGTVLLDPNGRVN
jgi:hypothetical protein